MLQYLVLYMCLCSCLTIQAPICTPTITEGKIGKPEIGGFISLECEIATCNNPTKIVFEKTDLNATWIPVFEGISKTQYKALDTAVGYTLENRNFYYAFRTSVHSLHIVPVILNDHGEWRCCVYDVTETKYNSGQLDVNVYVSPALDKFNITSNNSHVLFHQTKEFTCVVDGIHPEPEVLWRLNGVAHKGNTISQQRTDQLWVVMNTIRLRFDTLGVNELNCVLKAKAKDPWMEYHINITVQAPVCTPTLTEGQNGKPEICGFISLECEFATCNNLTKLVFEKVDRNASWTPIFEGVNQTSHKALDTATDYTIQNRSYYYAYLTSVQTLQITPLMLHDNGKWRCVVNDVSGKKYKSGPLDVNVYVQPAVEDFYINPNSSHLVVGQTKEFTCVVDGIHPEPEVLWKVNGVEHTGNATNKQREDKIWVVMTTIRLQWDTRGVNKLKCVIKTKSRDPWLENLIDITVQEKAVVLYPLHDMTLTVDVDAILSLRCIVSGYNPRITWERNGEYCLSNNTRYVMKDDCDNTTCDSSIASKPMNLSLACDDKEEYSGVYTCVVTLEPPYNSSATSSNMNVTILKTQCSGESFWQTVGIPLLSVMCVVLIAVGSLVYLKGKKKQREPNDMRDEEVQLLLCSRHHSETDQDYPSEDVKFYKNMELQDTLTPEYETAVYLKKCAKRESDDELVLFDFKKDRVFIHDMSDLTKHKDYTCNVKIYDMIRTSNDRFVVTEFMKRHVHLLQLKDDGTFHTLDTIGQNADDWRPLICADTNISFIWCDVSRHEPFKIKISRVNLTNDKLVPCHLTDVIVETKPTYISLKSDSTKLVMVNDHGTLYSVDLHRPNVACDHNVENIDIDGWVRSLYIDQQDNVIIGDGSQITVYTPDKKRCLVPKVGDRVRGVTVINGRIIVNCGFNGKQQHIKVYVDISTSKDINFYKNMELQDTITPEYEPKVCLKKCVKRQSDDKLVLFDFKNDRVFIHDMSDLSQYKEYKCDVKIYDMIRAPHDRFVVTEYMQCHIHLLKIEDGTFRTLYTMKQNADDWRPLICAATDTSFIWCAVGGHEPFDIKISRVDFTNDKLITSHISTVTVNMRPTYVSLTSDSTKLVMVNERGTLLTVDLHSHYVCTDHTVEHKNVDGWVRSLYIDQNDNIIIGYGSHLTILTHDKKRCLVPKVGDPVRGVTVDNERIIVNSGYNGKQQHIKVYVEIRTSKDINFYKSMEQQDIITPPYKTEVHLKKCIRRQRDDKLVLFDFQKNRVFIHDMSDLNQFKKYKCDVNIYDMIRASHDRFVVTEYMKRHIHLLHLRDGKLYILDTIKQDSDDWRPLICPDTGTTFMWCDISGHEPYKIGISRVHITNDKLVPHHITQIYVKTKPRYVFPTSDSTKLVMINERATLYTVDLESHEVDTDHSVENKEVDGWVRSLYIDQQENVIIGNGTQITVYTHDRKRCVMPIVGNRVRGVTVHNERVIVNCGRNGKQQYIKVYKTKRNPINDSNDEETCNIREQND